MAKARQLVICIENSRYETGLERRKIYVSIPDASAAKQGYLRVVDDSGEDYLYPAAMFVLIALPANVKRVVLQAAA